MTSKYWLKLYHELLDDSKVMTLRPALRWRFIECLLVAGECDQDGLIPDSPRYAWRVRASEEIVHTELTELAEAGLLTRADGQWYVNKFAERQVAVTGAERWKRWNERKRKQEYNDAPTSIKQSPNGTTNETTNETLDRSDKDIDKKREDSPPSSIHSGIADEITEMGVNPERDEQRREMISCISGVVRETFAIGFNSDTFEQVADALIDDGIAEDQVKQFGKWWEIPGNGYEGRPYLKSLLQNIKETAKPEAKTEWYE